MTANYGWTRNPSGTWSPPVPAFKPLYDRPYELRYCRTCGCLFSGPCPEHETKPVTIGPGREGLVIK